MRDAKTLFLRSRLVVGAGLCALVGGALTGCKTYEAALGTGAVLAECRDTEIGRKYAAELNAGAAQAAQTWANGYMSSFQSWGYAKAAFNKWSMLVAKRVADLQQIQPTP